MKVRLTEKQYNLLLEYIEEARKAPEPQKLSLFFNKSPDAQFFSVIQRVKGGSESEYDFKLSEVNGHKIITDINKGTKTKGCSVDASFDTMIYGTQLSIKFSKCGKTLTINNVVGLNIFDDLESLESQNPSDSIEFEHNLDKTAIDKAGEYYEELKNVDGGDEVHFDSKYKYDGTVVEKFRDSIRIELIQQGKKNKPNFLTVDLVQNPFYEEDGNLMFKCKITKGEEQETDFIFPIKDFFVDYKSDKKLKVDWTPELAQELDQKYGITSDDELKEDANELIELLAKDKDLKNAFYAQPTFWQLLVAELTGKKALGRGIVAALSLAVNYTKRNNIDKLGADFIENDKVTFTPVGTTRVSFVINGKDDDYVFDGNQNIEYAPIVLRKKFYKGFELEGQIQKGLRYIIEILDRVENSPDTFECEIIMLVGEGKDIKEFSHDDKFEIKINKTKSPGYKPKKTEEIKK